jgi:hypothetical protein
VSRHFSIEAPEDVFVVRIAPDGTLGIGRELAVMTSPWLQRTRQELLVLRGHLEIASRPFYDNRMAGHVEGISDSTLTPTFGHEAVAESGKMALDEVNAGIERANRAVAAAVNRKSPVSADVLATFEFSLIAQRVRDAKDGLLLAREYLDGQLMLMDELISRLTIRAPVEGRFVANALAGCFVKKGHSVGTLEVML